MRPHRRQPTRLPSLGFSRQEHWSGLPFPSPMHESEKWKWSGSAVSDSLQPHGLQPTRLLHPWDFPGKSTGVGAIAFSSWGLIVLKTIRMTLIRLQNDQHQDDYQSWLLCTWPSPSTCTLLKLPFKTSGPLISSWKFSLDTSLFSPQVASLSSLLKKQPFISYQHSSLKYWLLNGKQLTWVW